jgi:hypothetical protein
MITHSLDCMLVMCKIIQNTNYQVILLILLIVVTGQLHKLLKIDHGRWKLP